MPNMNWNSIKSKWKRFLPALISYIACLLVMGIIMLGYRTVYNWASTPDTNLSQSDPGIQSGADEKIIGLPAAALSRDTVIAVQERLFALGFLASEPDGIYSVETAKAVRAFQKSIGMTADGVCHIHTLEALGLTIPDTSPP